VTAATAAVTPAELTAFVDQLTILLRACQRGPVEVLDNPLAALLRRRLGPRVSETPVRSPAVVVDTSGSPERIRDALQRLEDLGTLVLTRGVGGEVSMNLYADLHLRSLSIMVVAAPDSLGPAASQRRWGGGGGAAT
jgi:hypothetical protein